MLLDTCVIKFGTVNPVMVTLQTGNECPRIHVVDVVIPKGGVAVRVMQRGTCTCKAVPGVRSGIAETAVCTHHGGNMCDCPKGSVLFERAAALTEQPDIDLTYECGDDSEEARASYRQGGASCRVVFDVGGCAAAKGREFSVALRSQPDCAGLHVASYALAGNGRIQVENYARRESSQLCTCLPVQVADANVRVMHYHAGTSGLCPITSITRDFARDVAAYFYQQTVVKAARKRLQRTYKELQCNLLVGDDEHDSKRARVTV